MPQFLPFARELHVHLADSHTNLTAEALPQIPNVWMLKSLFSSWDASVNITLPHPSIHPCCSSWSFSSFSSDPDQVYFNLMSYINLVFNFSFLPSLIDTLTVLAVLKHDPLSSFPLFLPITPCQFPCTSTSCGCLHLQVRNCFWNLFSPDCFPRLPLSHKELKSFDRCWILNCRRSFCLVCRISHY